MSKFKLHIFITLCIIISKSNTIWSQYLHDYPLEYDDYDQPEARSGQTDSNVFGQWTPDPDGEHLTTCDNGLALTMKKVLLPFNAIGKVIRFPSHHSLEFEVKCPDRVRKFNIDFTSDSVIRTRFGSFSYQFKRYNHFPVNEEWVKNFKLKY